MIHELIRSRGFVALIVSCVLGSAALHAQVYSEDFEDGSLSPFVVEKIAANTSEIITPAGLSARAGTKVHHVVWNQVNYDGTRASKSVEGASGSNPRMTSEGWYGFSFYMPESMPVPAKNLVIAQLMAWTPTVPVPPTCTVGFEPDGRLYIDGDYGVGDGNKVMTAQSTLAANLSKGSWHDIVIYVKLARNNTGVLKAWLDGAPEDAPTVSYTGINLGNGAWTNDTLMTNGAYIKWGPYCWDNAFYTPGEVREMFFDEIAYTVTNPSGAFDLVKPSGYGTGYAVPPPGPATMAEIFDTMTTGAQPTGFTVVKGTGTAATVSDIFSATNKCMQLSDSNATTRVDATKTFTALTSRFTASFRIRQSASADGHSFSLLSGSLSSVELYSVGGNLVYRDSTGTDSILQAIPANTWYDVDIDVNPATRKADVYVDGIRRITSASFRNATTAVDSIRFGTSNASASASLYVDDIVISQAPTIIVDNTDAAGVTLTGAWASSTGTPGYYGIDYIHDSNTGQGTKSVRFTPAISLAGTYEVFARWTAASNRSSQVPIDINYNGGSTTVTVNQRVNGSQWVSLGIHSFAAGTSGNVVVRNTAANGIVVADAVKFIKTLPVAIPVDNADATGVTLVGAWSASSGTPGYYGTDYLLDGNTGQGTKSVRFTPTVPFAGRYEVFVRWTAASNRSSQVPVTVTYDGGSATTTVNQRINGNLWVSLGVYDFAGGTSGNVLVSNSGANGYVIADAILLMQR
jgi:hypothetical protein